LFGHQYKVESLDNNQIALKFSVAHWLRAFGKSGNLMDISCRLSKQQGLPVLIVQCQSLSSNGAANVIVNQSVPVTVLQATSLLPEPVWKSLDAHIMLPPLHQLRKMIDKMKNVGNLISLSTDMQGRLNFRVGNDLVHVTTHYSDLQHPRLGESGVNDFDVSENPIKPGEFVSVSVDMRSITKFLQCYHLDAKNIVCCFSGDHGLIMYVYVDGPGSGDADRDIVGVMAHYIPCITK
jgi:HUS1 checkpoint protein